MKKLLILCALGLLIGACAPKNANMGNPLLQEYTTPFQTPPFDKILPEHFLPAMEEAMAMHKAEIQAILDNPDAPTFENTIVAYDKAGELLGKVRMAFGSLNGADTNDELQEIAKQMTPAMTRHSNEISLNPKLFERVKAVYDQRNDLHLNAQQMRTLEKYYDDFVRNGANLSQEDKDKLMEINTQLATLSLQYGQNLLKETNGFRLVVDNVEDMKGLPEANIQAAAAQYNADQAKAEAAKDAAASANQPSAGQKYAFTPAKPSWIPFLQYAENRDLREKLYKGYYMRGDNNNQNDNKALCGQIINLRLRRAKLLGYDTYADYALVNNMAKDPKTVTDFLVRVWTPALKVAKNELKEMQAIADQENKAQGKPTFKLESWDWWYYAEKLRKAKYNLDEQEIMPYLVLENVRDGMFYVANKLYGITFEKHTDIPTYNKEVETFEVKDKDGSHLAILYLDYPTRPGKRAGAWCSRLRTYSKNADGTEVFPLVTVTTNFSPSVEGKPTLLTWDEAETLFHEFGHALHGFFSRGDYDRICGSLPRDMVELPSQVNEHWASQPEVLKVYAKHYQTGEPMPDALIEKIQKSSYFNQGFTTVEFIAAALLDMSWHAAATEQEYDANAFEKKAMEGYGLIPEILPRYRSTYFSHVFNGGYAVGYYVYLWAEVLDADAFDAFSQSGDIFNPDYAAKFRQYILQDGGLDDPMTQYQRFRGQAPTETPLLRNRGLL